MDKKSTAPAFGAGAVYVVLTGSMLFVGLRLVGVVPAGGERFECYL